MIHKKPCQNAVAGNPMNMADRGISLEKMLKEIGFQKDLDWCFTEKFRKTHTDKGQQDFIHGFKAS